MEKPMAIVLRFYFDFFFFKMVLLCIPGCTRDHPPPVSPGLASKAQATTLRFTFRLLLMLFGALTQGFSHSCAVQLSYTPNSNFLGF
jgi:hypothetical protein